MCLVLYLAAKTTIPAIKNDDISVEELEGPAGAVRKWFSLPNVRYIGAPGCSCTFPNVSAEQPIEWYEGFFDEEEDRASELASIRALLNLLEQLLRDSDAIEMYPLWDGDETEPPKGTIAVNFETLEAEKFFFNERFLYLVTKTRRSV